MISSNPDAPPLDRRPSVESVLQLCADVWGEMIENLDLKVHRFRTLAGGRFWEARVYCPIDVPSVDGRCFVADGKSEIEAMAMLYDNVARAFRASPKAQETLSLMREIAKLPQPVEERPWIAWDRRWGRVIQIYSETEDGAIQEAFELFDYSVSELVQWNCGPCALVRVVAAPMFDYFTLEGLSDTEAKDESIAVLARIEAIEQR